MTGREKLMDVIERMTDKQLAEVLASICPSDFELPEDCHKSEGCMECWMYLLTSRI